MALHERAFFDECSELKPTTLTCPRCRVQAEYQVRWIRRTRKAAPPGGADERDRALFAKLKNYLVRVDDAVACKKCGRRFDIPSQQSLAFF